MGPFAAVDSVFTKYFTMRGRASRSEFWWYSLIQGFVMIACIIGDFVLFDPEAVIGNPFALMMFTLTWILITLVPNFTVAIRRLHDTGRSGMWYLINMVPIIGPFLYLFFLCLPSERDDNIYGQPPNGGGGVYSRLGSSSLEFSNSSVPKTGKTKASNPLAGYALLHQEPETRSAERVAAQKAEVKDYYRTHVLGRAS